MDATTKDLLKRAESLLRNYRTNTTLHHQLAMDISAHLAEAEKKPVYEKSGRLDKNGVEILEGSIINADGYKSRIEENHFHCVTRDDNGTFGSDIYSDFEPLSFYSEIEVVGHAEDYRELYHKGCTGEAEWSGNLGEGLK